MKLSKREQILGGLLSIAALLAVTILILGYCSRQRDQVRERLLTVELASAESEILLEEKEMWEERATWLAKHQREFPGQEVAESTLLQLARTSAAEAGVEVVGLEILRPPEDHPLPQAGGIIRLKGDIEELTRWIYHIQSPEGLRSITTLRLAPVERDPSKLGCEVELWQYYQQPPTEG